MITATSPRRSHHGPRRAARASLRLLVAGGACAALGLAGGPAAEAAPTAPRGVVWTVAWTAPVTAAGPNRFDAAPELKGTARYLLGGISRVDYTITAPAGLPATCGTFPKTGVATLSGSAFTVAPDLACNATYTVSVVAQSGSGLLAARSGALKAPLSLGDPGAAVGGARGAVDGASRAVSLAWTADADPDVTGYRIRRDGEAVADVGAETTTWAGTAPGVGSYTYDIAALRWGDAGPGSTSLVSPASAPLTATIDPAAPPGPAGGGSTPGGSTPGSTPGGSGSAPGTGSSAGGAGGAKGTVPPSPGAKASVPGGRSADAKLGPRGGYRSGGTISPRSGSSSSTGDEEVDTGYSEDLPYQPGTSLKEVEVAGPDGTRTVSSTVAVPSTSKPGLLVPLAVVLVLLAASLQIRALLGRARRAGEASSPDDLDLA